jgi:NAD-dependent dihydropyrimidine dehydrogenase PreA subunit
MKINRKIIEIDEELCNGCGQCVIACAEGAIEIIDGKAKVISDNLCDGLGACLGECPEGALLIIEREAEDFDEDAVETHLAEIEKNKEKTPVMPCGCPSTQLQSFGAPASPCQGSNQPASLASAQSALSNWPVQISLIPPTAPFLKRADLLVSADCVPIAFSAFHADFLKGKTVMMGCPKLDNPQEYIDKFAEIFRTADLKTLTCVIMEVPCCSGLPVILQKGMEAAGKKVPMEVIVISTRGEILETRKM